MQPFELRVSVGDTAEDLYMYDGRVEIGGYRV